MIYTMDTPEVLVHAQAETGEGPVLDPRTGQLAWVDIPAGTLHLTDLSTGEDHAVGYPTLLGAVAPRRGIGWAAATSEGFALLNGARMEIRDPVLPEPNRRMNDAKCDAYGRMWAGSTTLDLSLDAGNLHCWDGLSDSVIVRTGITLPNGIGWNADNTIMYFVDTMRHVLYAADFDLDDARIGALAPLARIPSGLPDGLCVADDGTIWLAVMGASEIQRISPSGDLVARIQLPVSQPSSCAIASDGTLYITTARGGLSQAQLAEQPEAGSVFALPIGLGPVPVAAFAA